ncbi:putative tetratricopeptide-like helical domain superfamily [Dioscorea sansibarensis]
MLAIPAPLRASPAAGDGSSSPPSPLFAFISRIRDRSRNCEHIRAALKESLASSSSPNAISPGAKSSARRAAVAKVKESTDLDSALLRVGGILQVHDLNLILCHFGESIRWNEVSQIFDWMLRCEKLNFASYGSFSKYIWNAKFEKSMELLGQMKDDGLQPDLVTYSTFLAGCAKMKHGYIKAVHLVQELENNGLHKDSVIYETVISICASNNLSEEAEAFFQQMLNEGCLLICSTTALC